jgi:hypothetical protein
MVRRLVALKDSELHDHHHRWRKSGEERGGRQIMQSFILYKSSYKEIVTVFFNILSSLTSNCPFAK